MDGFQLTIVAMAFSDSQWKDDWNAIALAEKRRAEFLGEAEYYRMAHKAAGTRSGRKPWGRDLVMALRARIDAVRRPDLAHPVDLVPAASETT